MSTISKLSIACPLSINIIGSFDARRELTALSVDSTFPFNNGRAGLDIFSFDYPFVPLFRGNVARNNGYPGEEGKFETFHGGISFALLRDFAWTLS